MNSETTLAKDGTQIRIFRETAERLKKQGKKGETYDDIIQKLMENGE